MPSWLAALIAIAAVVGAVSLLWGKVLKTAEMLALLRRVLPVMERLERVFGDSLSSLSVLDEIVHQVRTDSGSSLLDKINGLTAAAVVAQETAERVAAAVERDRDRADLIAQAVEVDRELAKVARDDARDTYLRIDRLAQVLSSMVKDRAAVAADLVVAEERVAGVAEDLAASQRRADEAGAEPGESADAASQSQDQPPQRPAGRESPDRRA